MYCKNGFVHITLLVVSVSCSQNIEPEPENDSKGCVPPIVEYADAVSINQIIGVWKVDSVNYYSCGKISDELFEYCLGQSRPMDYVLNIDVTGTIENIQGYYVMAIYCKQNGEVVSVADCFVCYVFGEATWELNDKLLIVHYPNYSEDFIIETLNDSVFNLINYDAGNYDENDNLLSFSSKSIRLIKK